VSAKILIVEDNDDQRDFLEILLSSEGYTVYTAGDGSEGIKQAQTRHPDLIITDIEMPELDGITMVKVLRDLPGYGEVPILMMSAYGSGSLRKGLRAGASRGLRKPVDIDLLIDSIKNLLATKFRRHSVA
jgi:two-component system, chemotaxis family, chemotaxis protein CheY